MANRRMLAREIMELDGFVDALGIWTKLTEIEVL